MTRSVRASNAGTGPCRAATALVVGVMLLPASLLSHVAIAGSSPLTERHADPWWRTTDGRLTLVSNTTADEARAVLELLTSLRRTVGAWLYETPVEVVVPTTVVLFADATSYEPFRLFGRDGQYLATPFESLVVVNARSDRRPMLRIAAHEYLHALVAGAGLALPLWLDEGLAEYYSTARVVGDRLLLGEPASDLASHLRGRRFLSFDQLLTLSSGSAVYLEDPVAERFYAQAWLLVHYVLSEPDGGARLTDLVTGLERGESAAAAIAAALGCDPGELDRRLRRYLNASSLRGIEVGLSPGPRESRWASRALDRVELAAELAVLATEQLRWERSPERLAMARDWIEKAAGMPGVGEGEGDLLALRARFHEMAGDRAAAAKLYARSIYLDARRARSYAYYAGFLLGSEGTAEERRDEENVAQARLLIERALELAPDHPWLETLAARVAAPGVAKPAGDRRAGLHR